MANSDASAVSRPLPLTWRKDFAAWQHRFGDEAFWIVQDPWALRYYRMRPEEMALLRMLDGTKSLEEICARYNRDYTPQRLAPADLLRFLCQTVRSGLVTSELPGAAERIAARRAQRAREQRRLVLQTPWMIPLGTVNPRGLVRLARWTLGPWLSRKGLAALLVLLALAGLALAADPAHAAAGLDDALWRLPWGGLVLAWWILLHAQHLATAVLLERYSGECRLLRLYLHYLVPSLLTPAVELWQSPRRSQRLAIDSAGPAVGMALGAAAFLAWRALPPGMAHDLALALWAVAVLVLGLHHLNPISGGAASDALSDLTDQPNLHTRGLSGLQARWFRFLRISTADEPRPLPRWILLKAAAQGIWQWLLALVFLRWAARRFVDGPDDPALWVITILAAGRLIVIPVWKLRQIFWIPGRMWEANGARVGLLSAFAALWIVYLLAPVPRVVERTAWTRPALRAAAVAPGDAIVSERLFAPGDAVSSGQPLVRFADPLDAAGALPPLVAPADGIVLALSNDPANIKQSPADALAGPGALLLGGRPYCAIARADRLNAVVSLPADVARRIQVGQQVALGAADAAQPSILATIAGIASLADDEESGDSVVPPSRRRSPKWRLDLALDAPAPELVAADQLRVWIRLGSQPLAMRLPQALPW